VDGVLAATVTTATVTLNLTGYDDYPPPAEVLDATMDDEYSEGVSYPPYVIIQWVGVAEASRYLVQRYDGSWTQVDSVVHSAVQYYQYRTSKIENDEAAQWRIVPVDTLGNQGTALSFNFAVIGNPPPPESVSVGYSGGYIQVGA
jgi:hypothetical protein